MSARRSVRQGPIVEQLLEHALGGSAEAGAREHGGEDIGDHARVSLEPDVGGAFEFARIKRPGFYATKDELAPYKAAPGKVLTIHFDGPCEGFSLNNSHLRLLCGFASRRVADGAACPEDGRPEGGDG